MSADIKFPMFWNVNVYCGVYRSTECVTFPEANVYLLLSSFFRFTEPISFKNRAALHRRLIPNVTRINIGLEYDFSLFLMLSPVDLKVGASYFFQ